MEAAGWGWKYLVRGIRARQAQQVLRRVRGQAFFLFPLQLSGDYQIRAIRRFPDMRSAAAYVIESFVAHAPEDVHLLIKTASFRYRHFQLAGLH